MQRRFMQMIAVVLVLVTTGFGCRLTPRGAREASRPIELEWWSVFDDSDMVDPLISEYRKIHPNITVNYRQLRFEEYEAELLDALAEARGPDIFTVHNTAIVKWQPKLLPLPREIKVAYQVTKGTIRKETVTEVRTEKALRIDQVKNLFVDQVAKDVILPHQDETGAVMDRIFGLPIGLDTLVLYWNRDLLNSARIPEPAKTWEEFLEQVKVLTKFDSAGKIIQSGAAIGAATNIERSTDVLSALMMQNGTVMIANGKVIFDQVPPGTERPVPPGLEALRFYTDFSNSGKEAYSWNENLPQSLDAFTAGTAAYFFGYAYHLPQIRGRAPKLNFGIAHLPQVDPANEVNISNYWIPVVSNRTTHPDEAWDFVQFASRAPQAKLYLAAAKKPTALRSLITEQLEDLDLSVFASQVLTAKSWYQGKDPDSATKALEDMITDVVRARFTIEEAISIAAGKVEQTLR